MITERDNTEVVVERAQWYARRIGKFEPTPYVSLEVEYAGECGNEMAQAELTPAEARALAAELNRVADKIEGRDSDALKAALARLTEREPITDQDEYSAGHCFYCGAASILVSLAGARTIPFHKDGCAWQAAALVSKEAQ